MKNLTLSDIFEEIDVILSIAFKVIQADGTETYMYLAEDGTLTNEFYDSKEFVYDKEAIRLCKTLNTMNIKAQIVVYSNAFDDYLIDDISENDLNSNFEVFKSIHSEKVPQWKTWFISSFDKN